MWRLVTPPRNLTPRVAGDNVRATRAARHQLDVLLFAMGLKLRRASPRGGRCALAAVAHKRAGKPPSEEPYELDDATFEARRAAVLAVLDRCGAVWAETEALDAGGWEGACSRVRGDASYVGDVVLRADAVDAGAFTLVLRLGGGGTLFTSDRGYVLRGGGAASLGYDFHGEADALDWFRLHSASARVLVNNGRVGGAAHYDSTQPVASHDVDPGLCSEEDAALLAALVARVTQRLAARGGSAAPSSSG